MSNIRQALLNSGLTVDTTNILMASWRDSTKSKYSVYINQWLSFCEYNGISYLQATPTEGLRYLTQMFNIGHQYSTIKAARSALSAIMSSTNGIPFGKQPIVCRFMRGVANIRPVLPKYTSIWHVSKVLNHFRTLDDNEQLTLRDLTLKVATLLCLVLIQRSQTIHTFDTKYIRIESVGAHIAFPQLIKQSRPAYHPKPIFMKRFEEPQVCPVRALEAYVHRTLYLRGDKSQLFISYIRPYDVVSIKTIYGWLKTALHESGIDTSVFQGHSLRVAGGSSAKIGGVPITNILKMAGWSGAETFTGHYDKPVEVDIPKAILKQ